MSHLHEVTDERNAWPRRGIRPVPNEKGEQPTLEPECDTRRCGGPSVRKPDVERLAEERVVQVERRRGDGGARTHGQQQLVLQLLQPLQHVLGPRTRRKEWVARQRDGRIEVERASEGGNAIGGALEERARITVGPD